MKAFSRKYLAVILLILVSAGILYHNFSKVFACPECYLFEDAGDGLKNYFTYTWYVLEDRGAHFSGMNAPYGEHIFFTDNHPGLALVTNFIHRHIMDLNGNTIGIINILLICSLFIAILILYSIFRMLSVGRYPAAAFAIVIAFLSPQIARFSGHFSLAHVNLVPAFIWLFLKYHLSGGKWKWAVLTMLWITMCGFIHLYYFLMMAVFTAFYLLIDFFQKKYWRTWQGGNKALGGRALQIISMLIIPALLLLLFLHFTDHVPDRPTSPWRSHGLNARFHGTFVPYYGTFPDYWKGLFGTPMPNPESMSYVSLVGFFFIPVALAFLIRGLRRKKKHTPGDTVHTFLLAAVGVWAIAAGALYAPPLDAILDIIPKLKQFRGVGRLAWMFYYVYTIFMAYYLYRLSKFLGMKARHPAGKYLLFISLLVMGFEAYLIQRPILARIFKPNQYLSVKTNTFSGILESNGLKAGDFQAILQLPLVNLGGETSGVERGLWTMRKGIQAAFETRLPLVDWSLSRTSVSQSTDFIQLISTSAVKKRRLEHMNTKPLLLVCEEEFVIPAEQKLIDKAEFLGRSETVTVYLLPVSAFDQDLDAWRTRLDTIQNPARPIASMDFEDDPHPAPLIGKGVKKVRENQDPFFTYTSSLDSSAAAIVHLWVYINTDDATMSVLRIREIAPDGKVIYDEGIHRSNVPWSEVVGQWMRIDRPVTIREKGYTYEFYMDEKGSEIDGLQIRRRDANTVIEYPGHDITFLNGVLIPGSGPSR